MSDKELDILAEIKALKRENAVLIRTIALVNDERKMGSMDYRITLAKIQAEKEIPK